MPRYSAERKAAVLKKLLPPNNRTVVAVSTEEGISNVTLYSWLKQCRQQGVPVPGQRHTGDDWSAEAKLAVVIETASSSTAGRFESAALVWPRVQEKKSVAAKPNERWSTDLARVWCGQQHRWCALAIVMDCHTREALGWRLSRPGNAATAEAALEEALINRYGALGKAPDKIMLRSDNGLVFTSRQFTRTVYQYGLQQEFIRPHTPQQNGMVERLIRTVKEQCLWLHNFESLEEARQALGAWFVYYNDHRPHQALGMKTPKMTYQLAA